MEGNTEKAILVGVKLKRDSNFNFESSMQELKSLTETAGGRVVATLEQIRNRPESSTYIGKGKLEELSHLVEELEPDLIVFDSELSPAQINNLEKSLNTRIIDRTMLILDIFNQRARSREGKLQVELASLQYRLPRLTGQGKAMSRTGGGIGTRGLGEQKLELDKRYIRKRIQENKKQMKKVQVTRELHRKQRKRAGLKEVSLVGYTNAGKSSLFNTLCKVAHSSGDAQVEANARLFQTLDTTTRKISLSPHQDILITDTVGFIQNLPHQLIAAFRSTLEETIEADLLLHVVDVSETEYLDKIQVVEKVLLELGAQKNRIITVFNKADLLPDIPVGDSTGIYVSAQTGWGINQLIKVLEEQLI